MHIKEIVFAFEVNGKKYQTRTFVNEKVWENNPTYQASCLESAKKDLARRIVDNLEIKMTIVETEIPDVRK